MCAFAGEASLVPCAGFQRETRQKSRYKGTLIGTQVITEFRGQRAGQLFLAGVIDVVRMVDGMEQLNQAVTRSHGGAKHAIVEARRPTLRGSRKT